MQEKERKQRNRARGKMAAHGSNLYSRHGIASRALEGEANSLQELLKSKERFSLVAQAADLGTWDWDLRSNELVWSQRCFSLFGLGPNTAISHERFLRAVHPEDRARVEGAVKRAIDSHSDYDMEMRTLWPDGSLHWVSSRGRAYYDDAGQPIRMLGIASEITERKRAEEALRDSEARFRSLFDSSPDAVFLTIPDGTTTAANPAACAMFGMTEEELCRVGRAGVIAPDETRLAAAMEERARTGKFRSELTFVRKDGTRFDGEVSSVLVGGVPARSFVVVRDITERKRAEEELRVTTDRFKVSLRGSAIVVFSQDLELRYTWLYCPDLGHSPAEIIGKRDRDIYPRAEDAAVTEAIKSEVIRTGFRRREEVVLYWRGKERRYDLLVDPLLDSEGKIAGVTCAAIDITDRKLAQEALIRSEKLASLGRMAATISHEINNPLEGVMNLLYLANTAQGLPETARQYLETASEELNRIAQITRQSLGFYRESGKPASTSVNEAAQSALDLLRTKIREKHAIIRQQCDEDVHVIAVAGELRQVFANLLVNSLDAIANKGTIALRISRCSALKDGGQCVRITIADNGTGISASMQRQVFDALFTTKGAIGTGLGLWVSKQIIDKHGGSIRLRSSTDKDRHGTVFSIVLPAETEASLQRKSASA
jgi:PAS domain S-box-containing protein